MMDIALAPLLDTLPPPVEATEADDAAARRAAVAARAERAAMILREGNVEALGNGRFRVRRTPKARWYAVREGYCNCPDFAWRGEVPCKHLIAVALVQPLRSSAA